MSGDSRLSLFADQVRGDQLDFVQGAKQFEILLEGLAHPGAEHGQSAAKGV